MQFGGVYGRTFQPQNVTGCGSEGVNSAHVIHVAAFLLQICFLCLDFVLAEPSTV